MLSLPFITKILYFVPAGPHDAQDCRVLQGGLPQPGLHHLQRVAQVCLGAHQAKGQGSLKGK